MYNVQSIFFVQNSLVRGQLGPIGFCPNSLSPHTICSHAIFFQMIFVPWFLVQILLSTRQVWSKWFWSIALWSMYYFVPCIFFFFFFYKKLLFLFSALSVLIHKIMSPIQLWPNIGILLYYSVLTSIMYLSQLWKYNLLSYTFLVWWIKGNIRPGGGGGWKVEYLSSCSRRWHVCIKTRFHHPS